MKSPHPTDYVQIAFQIHHLFLLYEHTVTPGLLITVFTCLCFLMYIAQCAASASWHVSILLLEVACKPLGDIPIARNRTALPPLFTQGR